MNLGIIIVLMSIILSKFTFLRTAQKHTNIIGKTLSIIGHGLAMYNSNNKMLIILSIDTLHYNITLLAVELWRGFVYIHACCLTMHS